MGAIAPAPTGRSAWTAGIWRTGSDYIDESMMLVNGAEECSLCQDCFVNVKLNPCGHEMCLMCCNRIRASNIFRVSPHFVPNRARPSHPRIVLGCNVGSSSITCRWMLESSAQYAVATCTSSLTS
jgi:hypothetical protein